MYIQAGTSVVDSMFADHTTAGTTCWRMCPRSGRDRTERINAFVQGEVVCSASSFVWWMLWLCQAYLIKKLLDCFDIEFIGFIYGLDCQLSDPSSWPALRATVGNPDKRQSFSNIIKYRSRVFASIVE